MPVRSGTVVEKLEQRQLFAVRTVDFDNYPINFTQFDWMLQSSHTPTTGFSYTIGNGAGQRPNVNGISWADSSYYETVLGAGSFDTVNAWDMKPLVLYTQAKPGGWLTQGWNYVPDMAEGAACIDDAARAAIAYAEDYLQNGTISSYQTAREIYTFVAYMTTRQGKVYNFAWLDAAETFAWDPIYSQDKHFHYRSEYVKRTAYPSATPSGAWFDQNSDTPRIINWPNPIRANPFIAHAKFSVYIDDLRDASNNDVATVYDGPLYSTAAGGPTSFKTGIKKTYTNSTQHFGFDEGRAIPALAKGLLMMQKREAEVGTLSADETIFAKFLENNMYRLLRNLQANNVGGFDSKLGASVLAGLADYYQLFYGSTEYGTYAFKLDATSNTPETGDDRLPAANLMVMIDNLSLGLRNRQVRNATWRNGIFADDGTGNSWDAWGQQQMYALARTYRMKVNIGADPAAANVAALLDTAAYAADNFYGIEAYHYLAPGTDNVRTKERITGISGGGALYHTNSGQIAYHNTSIIAGLRELAQAYNVSDRPDKLTRINTYVNAVKSVASWFIGNNTSLLDMYDGGGGSFNGGAIAGTFRGRGAAFDGINSNGQGIPNINRNTGGESFSEALWGMILAKDAIRDFAATTTFAFETGTSAAPAPAMAGSFQFDTPQPAIRFIFSQDIGPSLHAFDINITNTATNQRIATSSIALAFDFIARELKITFPGLANNSLPDGNYRVTMPAGSVVGNSGNPTLVDYSFTFFSFAGDADHDRDVDIADFSVLAAHFNQPATFSGGDFNYNGTVEIGDFSILASRFNQTLPAARTTPFNTTSPIDKTSPQSAERRIVQDVLETV